MVFLIDTQFLLVSLLTVVAIGSLALSIPYCSFLEKKVVRSISLTILIFDIIALVNFRQEDEFVIDRIPVQEELSEGMVQRLVAQYTSSNTQSDYCQRRHGMQLPNAAHSDELRRVLTDYSAFHASATRNRSALAADLLRAAALPSGSAYQYLCVNLSASGMGNRINTVLSSFTLALLTRRVLLISQPEFDWSELFCQPFPGGDWIWPASLPWHLLREVQQRHRPPQGGSRLETIMGADWSLLESAITTERPDGGTGPLEGNGDILLAPLLQYKDGEMYFVPLFYASQWRPTMDRLFPGRDVAHRLISFLLHPRDNVWREVQDTVAALRGVAGTTRTVGVQVRVVELDKLLQCVPAAPTRLSPAGNGSEVGSAANSSVFIASLDDHRSAVAAAFPHWRVTQKYSASLEQHTCAQFKTAVHDIWVLGMLDDLVLTPGSTFGYLAAALRGVPGWYPNTMPECVDSSSRRMPTNHSSSACFRAASFEPCFFRGLFLGDHHQRTTDAAAGSVLVRCEDSCGEMTVDTVADASVRLARGWRLKTARAAQH